MRLVGVLGAWLAMLHGLAAGAGVESRDADVLRIGFGSCANQRKPNPMWRVMREAAPDLMVLLGDNVYADSVIVPPLRTPATVEALEQSYAQLLSLPDFQALRADTPLLAVFDDHDYGKNDGDESWELRTTAQRLLQDTFDQDPRLGIASRRQQSAMYTVWRHQWHGLRVRIILLDNRSHKSRQPRFYVSEHHAQDMLGPEQWSWLESELRTQSADLTIIGSGLQFVAQDKVAGEQWGRFPASRAKLLALLATTNTANVVFLSGDVHLAEVSHAHCAFASGTLVDATSSGMTHSWGGPREAVLRWMADAQERVGPAITQLNIGLLELQCNDPASVARGKHNQTCHSPVLHINVMGAEGARLIHRRYEVAELYRPAAILSTELRQALETCASSDPRHGLDPACKRVSQACSPRLTDMRVLSGTFRLCSALGLMVFLLMFIVGWPCRALVLRRSRYLRWEVPLYLFLLAYFVRLLLNR